ncbi:MAG: S41 family peptidase [Cyclobacteriaceae bacterium]
MLSKYQYPATCCILLLLSMVFSACEALFIEPDPKNNSRQNLEILWKTVDEKYSFFELKNIDWDEVKERYIARIPNREMREEELFDLLADMLFELEDGHVNLISDFDVSRNWLWYLDYPPNFNWNIIERNYLGDDYRIAGPFRTKQIGNVGYIHYDSFMSDISTDVLDRLLNSYQGTSGLIIDLRNNQGGLLLNSDLLMSHFVSEKYLAGYVRYKEGPGHQDFSRPIPHYIEPEDDIYIYTKPVVILTNRQVYSAANIFTAMMQQLPNVRVVGDFTGGGGGAPISSELPNGWRYRFSTNQFLNAAQEQIEEGIAPDFRVDMLPEDEAAGVDTILEFALTLFM